jgi:ATP-dependent DNA ligase
MAKREKSRDNWLLIKERDAFARDNSDLPGEHITSVTTGRTRDQIAGGDGEARAQPDYIQPMLCKLVDTSPTGKGWLHEEKYDGYRLQSPRRVHKSSYAPVMAWIGRQNFLPSQRARKSYKPIRPLSTAKR